jgi:hypothetical protein
MPSINTPARITVTVWPAPFCPNATVTDAKKQTIAQRKTFVMDSLIR